VEEEEEDLYFISLHLIQKLAGPIILPYQQEFDLKQSDESFPFQVILVPQKLEE